MHGLIDDHHEGRHRYEMQVGKNVVFGVGAAFVAMIAIIFFLLGRESKRDRPAQPGVVVQTDETAPDPAPPSVPPSVSDPSPASPPSPPREAPAAPAITPAPISRAPAGSSNDAKAVRDYFIQMDSIQAFTGATDTGEYANTLLTGAMSGDMSGFDKVLELAQAGTARARAISPPAVCQSYHDQMLGLLDEGTAMLRQLMDAIKRSDTTALASLATTGNALKTRADALEAEAKAIKSRFGIAN